MKKTSLKTAPKGVVTDKPIGLRLLPAERAALKRHARAVNHSLAGFARLMVLAGLREYAAPGASAVQRVTPNR